MAWQLDPTHTEIQFAVKHMRFTTVRGTFEDVALETNIDESDITRSGATLTLRADSLKTGSPDRDGHLRSADFFDVENHPTVTFTVKRIEPKGGEDEYRLVGDLTVKGITREVVFEGEAVGPFEDPWGGSRIALTAETTVNRKDFGLTWNLPLGIGGAMLGETAKLSIDAQLTKAA